MANRSECEVAVVGASLAATALAIQLGSRCSAITLVEGREFPRRKTCGEGLSRRGLQTLQTLGIDVAQLPHSPLRGYRIHLGKMKVAAIDLSDSGLDAGGGIGVQRTNLDNVLLQHAVSQPGVNVLFGSRVKSCREFSDHCELQLSDGRQIASRYVVVASGAGQRFSARSSSARRLDRYAFSQQLTFNSARARFTNVEIIVAREFELYITPVGDGIINLAVLAPKRHFAELHSTSGRRRILSILERNFQSKFTPIAEPLPTGPVGNVTRTATQGRMFFVGDACEQFDPIGGMGMTHALVSGKIAADCIAPLLCNEVSLIEATRRYNVLRAEAARPLRGFTRLTYFMLVTLAGSELSGVLATSELARRVSSAIHKTDSCFSTRLSQKLVELAGI